MKKMIAVGLLLCVILFMQGCGIAKVRKWESEMKSIQQVDAYLEQENANAKAKSEVCDLKMIGSNASMKAGAVATIITMPLMFLNPLSALDKAMSAVYLLYVGAHATNLAQSGIWFSGLVDFKRYVEISRSGHGKPETDLVADVFKKIPPMKTCVPVDIEQKNLFGMEYKGIDGYVKVDNDVRIKFYFGGKIDENTQQSRCDLQEAKEYFKLALIEIAKSADSKLSADLRALPDPVVEFRADAGCVTYFCKNRVKRQQEKKKELELQKQKELEKQI